MWRGERFKPNRAAMRCVVGLAGGLCLACGGQASGGMVSQTVDVPGRTLFAGVTGTESAALEIAAVFDTFDPALGTLSSIVVEHSFDFEIDVVPMGAGGAGSGAAGITGLLKINDDLAFSGNGGGNGGTESGITYNVAGVDTLLPTSAAPAWIDAFTGGPGQTVKVAFDGDANARVVISPAEVTHRLLDGSFWKVTYVYDAAGGGVIGDFNGSGQVEQGDLDLVLQNWGDDTDVTGLPAGWVNDNDNVGLIEQTELDRVLTNWGSTSAPDFRGAVVPEPVALALAGAGLVVLHRRR